MNSIRRTPRSRRQVAGFTLIEALIAFLITAFGMLAIAGMQLTVSRNSEVAKQRSEAVRLAQQKIEELRSFEQVGSDGAKFDYTSDVVSGGPETLSPTSGGYTTNTAFARTWTITKDGTNAASGADLQKWISVVVAWTDRANENQSVTLRSVISRADPINLGTLLTGPGGVQVRRPKGREINIPYPAISLPGDLSSFKPPTATVNYVFDNISGNVLGFCSDAAIAASLSGGTAITFTGTPTTGCTAQAAYILSGYIRFLNNLPNGNEKNVDNGISNANDATKELSAQVVFNSTVSSGAAADCFTQRQKVVSVGGITVRDIGTAARTANVVTITTAANHGFSAGQIVAVNDVTNKSFNGIFTIATASGNTFTYSQVGPNASSSGGTPIPTATLVQQVTIAESVAAPTGYSTVEARFVAYTCVVRGIDDTVSPQPAPITKARWWGQFVITPLVTSPDVTAWTLSATGSTNWKVCRFTGDYISDDVISNSEHPLHYRGVSGPLDNQNYLVIKGNDTCPTDSEVDLLGGDYINTNTVLHQTTATGGLPYGGSLSTGSQWSGGGQEQSVSTTTPLLMF